MPRWTESKLWTLRQEIVLNSLFTTDFKNSFNVKPDICQEFFDSYIEYLYEIADEEPNANQYKNDITALINDFDSSEMLWRWYNCFEEEPLPYK